MRECDDGNMGLFGNKHNNSDLSVVGQRVRLLLETTEIV